MKRSILSLILLCSAAILFAYSKPAKAKSLTLSGHIQVYGNEPFTFIGLVTDDGKEYSLQAENEVLSELRKSQGYKIEITGFLEAKEKSSDGSVIAPNTLKDGIITLSEWKFIDKPVEEILEIKGNNISD
ncbi:MAG: hypothetical protein K6C97_04185 [Treponema sp.]|nr:hypothetical protein [Treponema sp.]